MSKYCLDEVNFDSMTASSKARQDVTDILKNLGYQSVNFNCDYSHGFIKSVISALKVTHEVLKRLKTMELGSIVLLQHPFNCYTNYFGRKIHKICIKRNIKTIVLIHDVDTIRYSNYHGMNKGYLYTKLFRDEISYLNQFQDIISHNKKMTKYLVDKGIDSAKIHNLSIFDYLVSNYDVVDKVNRNNFKTVYLAGNLSEAKSRYVYELPKLEFSSYIIELFGVNYTGISNEYIHYNGAVKPEELPKNIFTGFGLVWDGDSLDTCTGNLGNYLKFNNPHKLSSYIACGIPVIVWKEAAISDFVKENKIGFSIQNLKEIDSILKYLSYDDYIEMKGNVLSIRENIITGSYLKNTVLAIEGE